MNFRINGFMLALLVVAIGLTLTSCDENFFTKTIEVDSDWEGPNPVVHARMNTADDTLSLLLHYTKPVFEISKKGIDHIENAEIQLRGTDGSLYSFQFDSTYSRYANYFAIADPKLVEGVTYELSINHPDFEEIIATQTMPMSLVNMGFQWTRNYRRDLIDSTDYTLLELTYKEQEGPLYSSHIIQFKGQIEGEDILLPANFTSTRFEFGTFDFEGEIFDNLSVSNQSNPKVIYEIDTDLIDLASELNNPDVVINAISITQDDYLFYETVSAQTVTANLPFVEPVIVYGNMENALGIFSLINTTEYSIPLPQ